MELHSERFLENASDALRNTGAAERRDAIGLFAPLLRSAAVDAFEGFDDLADDFMATLPVLPASSVAAVAAPGNTELERLVKQVS